MLCKQAGTAQRAAHFWFVGRCSARFPTSARPYISRTAPNPHLQLAQEVLRICSPGRQLHIPYWLPAGAAPKVDAPLVQLQQSQVLRKRWWACARTDMSHAARSVLYMAAKLVGHLQLACTHQEGWVVGIELRHQLL